MPKKQSKKRNLLKDFFTKGLLVIVVLILITAVVVSSPIWWKYDKVLKTQKEHIYSLEKEVQSLSDKIRVLSE